MNSRTSKEAQMEHDNACKALETALKNRNASIVRTLLDSNPGIVPAHAADERPFPVVAVCDSNAECLQILIDHGANVDASHGYRWRAIHYAVREGEIECLKILIKNGADVNAKIFYWDWTPLHLAAIRESTTILEILLKQKPSLNALDNEKKTPLAWAFKKNNYESVEMLLRAGSDVNFKFSDYPEETLLHRACRNSDVKMVELLLKYGANVDAKNASGETPLYLAAEAGNLEMVELLLKYKANTCIPNKTILTTPLMEAARNGHIEVVKSLLTSDVKSIDAQNHNGCTALHIALRCGHLDIFRLLLEHKPSLHIVDNESSTLLMHAIRNKQEEIVELLLRDPVAANSIDAKNNRASSALTIAVMTGLPRIAKMLMDANANVDISSLRNNAVFETNFTYAANNKMEECADELLSKALQNEKISKFDLLIGMLSHPSEVQFNCLMRLLENKKYNSLFNQEVVKKRPLLKSVKNRIYYYIKAQPLETRLRLYPIVFDNETALGGIVNAQRRGKHCDKTRVNSTAWWINRMYEQDKKLSPAVTAEAITTAPQAPVTNNSVDSISDANEKLSKHPYLKLAEQAAAENTPPNASPDPIGQAFAEVLKPFQSTRPTLLDQLGNDDLFATPVDISSTAVVMQQLHSEPEKIVADHSREDVKEDSVATSKAETGLFAVPKDFNMEQAVKQLITPTDDCDEKQKTILDEPKKIEKRKKAMLN